MTKATSRAGTAIHGLRVATFLPVVRQKAGSCGVQSVMVRPGRYRAGSASASGACCVAEPMTWS